MSVVEIVPPTRREPRPSSVIGRSRRTGISEQRLLRDPRLVPQAVQLPRVHLVPLAFEPLLQQTRERQVHVVAAEQDVLADRDALEREIAVPLADGDQAEVGRAAADVADEHEIADAPRGAASRRRARRSQA